MARLILMLLLAGPIGCMAAKAGDSGPPDGWEHDIMEDGQVDGTDAEAPVTGNIDDNPSVLRESADYNECEGHDGRECSDHAQCDDGIFCNGEERCGYFCGVAYCYTVYPPRCYDPPPADPECAPPVCLEEQQTCIFPPKDTDRDGYVDRACSGDDCDDEDESVHPGLADRCDGVDNNCNGAVDEEGWSMPEGMEEPIALSQGAAYDGSPALAASTSGWLAAWAEEGSMIKVAQVDAAGTASVSTLAEAEPGSIMANASILGRDDGACVVWSESGAAGSSILMKGVGLPIGSLPSLLYRSGGVIEEIDDVTALDVQPGSSRAGIFFRMGVSGESGNYEIFYLPVMDYGATPPSMAGDGTPVRLTHALGFSGHPDAVSLEHGWTVLWDDDREGSSAIYLTNIDFSGGFLSEPAWKITSSPGGAQDPRVACLLDPGLCGIVWVDERYGNFAVFSTLMDAAGGLAGELVLSGESSNAWTPALVSDPVRGQMIAAFSAGTQLNRNRIYLSVFGSDTETAHAPIALQVDSEGSLSPSLAMDGSGRLAAAWIEISPTGMFMQILECR